MFNLKNFVCFLILLTVIKSFHGSLLLSNIRRSISYCLISTSLGLSPSPALTLSSEQSSFTSPVSDSYDSYISCDDVLIKTSSLKAIGGGGTGNVYAAQALVPHSLLPKVSYKNSLNNGIDSSLSNKKSLEDVAIKISKPGEESKLKNECSISQTLHDVAGVEHCLALCSASIPPESASPPSTLLVLSPLFPSSSSSTIESLPVSVQPAAISSVIRTLIDVLSHRITVSDVQFLFNPHTGESLLIDLTEAVAMTNPIPKRNPNPNPNPSSNFNTDSTSTVTGQSSVPSSTLLDLARARNFISEVESVVMSSPTLSDDPSQWRLNVNEALQGLGKEEEEEEAMSRTWIGELLMEIDG